MKLTKLAVDKLSPPPSVSSGKTAQIRFYDDAMKKGRGQVPLFIIYFNLKTFQKITSTQGQRVQVPSFDLIKLKDGT